MSRKGLNIYKRKDNRWEGRYLKGRKENNKPDYGYIYGKSFTEVKEKLLPLKNSYSAHDKKICSYTGTLSEWIAAWIYDLKKTNIKHSTYSVYIGNIQNHILPELGNMKLAKIAEQDIKKFKSGLLAKGLSPNSARSILVLLRRILDAAIEDEVLAANPMQKVKLPKAEKTHIKALNRLEQAKLEMAASNERYSLAIILALYTGMRIGEICALQWQDVDLDSGQIHIRHTVQRIKSHNKNQTKSILFFSTAKSERAIRDIPLTPKLQKRLAEEKEKLNSNFVITCKGHMAEPRLVSYHYKKIVSRLGIGHLRFHDLRHTFATRCLETGMDVETLSQILGHSSTQMTLDVYTDSTPQHKTKAINKLDDMQLASKA